MRHLKITRDDVNLDEVLVTSNYQDMADSAQIMLQLLEDDMRNVKGPNHKDKLNEMSIHHDNVCKVASEIALAERNYKKFLSKKYMELHDTYQFLGGK